MTVLRWDVGDGVVELTAVLDAGGILGIPTESSYGLGVDPRDPSGVAAIFSLKTRESRKPLPVVAGNLAQLALLGIDPEDGKIQAIAALWPAPLSLVVDLDADWPAAAGGRSLAVRIPAHPLLCRLLLELGRPLTATSANRSGDPPIFAAEQLDELLRELPAAIIDAGTLPGGPPSTIVEATPGGWRVRRRGRFPVEELRARLGAEVTVEVESDSAPKGAASASRARLEAQDGDLRCEEKR